MDKTSGINFPTFHALNNKYIEHRKIADKKVKKCNNIICISVAVGAIALAIIYGNPVIAIVIGVLALTLAIIMSDLIRRYIENEFQKEMFIELENQCESQEKGVISKIESTAEEPILDMEEVNSRYRQ